MYGPIAEGACVVLTIVLHREFETVGGIISIIPFLPFYFLLDKFSKGCCSVEKILDETFDG